MPWEDILEALKQNCADRKLNEIPHPEDCLKYMLRVVLKVNAMSFKKHLKQLMVRPYVLIALLDFLIDRNHEVFRGKGSAQDLRAKMRSAVQREYPETEADKPESERQGHIPPSIEAMLDATEQENPKPGEATEASFPGSGGTTERPKKKHRQLLGEKNATPGDGGRDLHECLDNIRP